MTLAWTEVGEHWMEAKAGRRVVSEARSILVVVEAVARAALGLTLLGPHLTCTVSLHLRQSLRLRIFVISACHQRKDHLAGALQILTSRSAQQSSQLSTYCHLSVFDHCQTGP